jgi:hypothetical protein
MPQQKEHFRYRRGWPFWMAGSILINKKPIRADDTANGHLSINDLLVLRKHFETQSEVQIQAASTGRGRQPGAGVRPRRERPRAGRTGAERGRTWADPGRFRHRGLDGAERAGWGRFAASAVRGGKLKNWKPNALLGLAAARISDFQDFRFSATPAGAGLGRFRTAASGCLRSSDNHSGIHL